MPTKTFFNLPAEKRNKLMDAIRAEFSRVPPEEVSINQIIKQAGIPRGSFYQYFDDKQDVLHHLLADYRQKLRHSALESLAASGGDLFSMFLAVWDFTYGFATREQNKALCQNLFTDIRVNTDLLYRQAAGEDAFADWEETLLPHIDTDALDIQGPEDLGNMLAILLPVTGAAFARALCDMAAYEEARCQYEARLALLRRGFSKNKTAKAG